MNIEACLICGKPLEYLTVAEEMTCSFCGKTFTSNTRCIADHYVCDLCHSEQCVKQVKDYCLQSHSSNPIEIINDLMAIPYVHMHGPEHHFLIGCALLTACRNGQQDKVSMNVPTSTNHIKEHFDRYLEEIIQRGQKVPGGICGLWGSCGAGIGSGILISVITEATPYSQEEFALANRMTAESLAAISEFGGPRCCKRDCFTAIRQAAEFIRTHFQIILDLPDVIHCHSFEKNEQCLHRRCSYFPHS